MHVDMAWHTVARPTVQSTMRQLVDRGIVKNKANESDTCYKCGEKGHWSVMCN